MKPPRGREPDREPMLLIPAALTTMGELAGWLDGQPPARLFGYMMYGTGDLERRACFAALVRAELRHQLAHHAEDYRALLRGESPGAPPPEIDKTPPPA